LKHLRRSSVTELSPTSPITLSPRAMRSSSPGTMPQGGDEEATLGLTPSRSQRKQGRGLNSPSLGSMRSHASDTPLSPFSHSHGRPFKRRPTAVRVLSPERFRDDSHRRVVGHHGDVAGRSTLKRRRKPSERTPLIKAGVKPDLRKSIDDTQATMDVMRRAEVGLGRMVELGLPLIM